MIDLVSVAGGTFNNGSANVTVSDFRMGKYEVTQTQYFALMGNNPSPVQALANGPMNGVSWYDALVFCNKLSLQEGRTPVYRLGGSTDPADWGSVPDTANATWDAVSMNMSANGFRLPTESEWEFAARGGSSTHGYTYAGSNVIEDVAWMISNSGYTVHAVGTKIANESGQYDMSGNSWELVWDRFGSYSLVDATNPVGTDSGDERILRGGGYFNLSESCAVSYRLSSFAYTRGYNWGFRVVCR